MTLQQLKEELNKYYKFDISERNRQREYSYARKVYCRLARELGYTFQSLGQEIGLKHDAALYHYRDFDIVKKHDKKIYNQVIKENKLNIIRSEDVISEEKERLLDNVLDTISKWNEETIDNFINTRLKVYNKLIETTKPQKKIKEVKGATLNRPVKNPVLC